MKLKANENTTPPLEHTESPGENFSSETLKVIYFTLSKLFKNY